MLPPFRLLLGVSRSGATKRVLQVADGRDRPRHPEITSPGLKKKQLKHWGPPRWGGCETCP